MRIKTAGAALAIMIGAAACGGSSGSSSTGSGSGGSSGGAVQHPTSLKAEVGKNDSFTISLTDQNGQPITNLAAGTYTMQVADDSTIHNFHLFGGSVNDATQVATTGTKDFTVKFSPGTYTFQCDTHPSQMHGTFKVS